MSISSRILSLVRSIPYRRNPALRLCRSITVVDAKKFSVQKDARLRGDLCCREASLIVANRVVVAPGTEVNAQEGSVLLIDEGVFIGKHSVLSVASNATLSIGKNTTFFSTVHLSGAISIGRDCLFGPNVTILTGEHVIEDRRPIRIQDAEYLAKHGHPPHRPVTIGDDCWIGVNAVILPGVSLGKGCVVAAGAVVTGSFDEYSVVGGVPARLLKYR